MKGEFFVAAAGCVLFVAAGIFYGAKISAKKNQLKKDGKKIAKKSSAFVSSILLCALVEILPFLIPLKILVIFVVCACGVLGEILVLRERLEKLAE